MRRFLRNCCAPLPITFAAVSVFLIIAAGMGRAEQAPTKPGARSVFQVTTVKAPTQEPPELLPPDFAGWHRTAAPVRLQPADDGEAEVLREYGFTRRVKSDYSRDTDKLSLVATQFADASGAYGAYTLQRGANWPKEDVGQDGASDNNRVVFWTGNTLIDATFDHVSSMTGSELRELAGQLPRPMGPSAIPPPLLHYLPQAALESQTTRYALGPESYRRGGGVLPASLAGFDRGGEVITARYSTRDGEGALTMLSYPTPQMAAERQRAIEAFLKAGNPKPGSATQNGTKPAGPGASPDASTEAGTAAVAGVAGNVAANNAKVNQGPDDWPQPLAESNPAILLVRRSGPIVALTSGTLPLTDARKLLSQVNYTADVTWNNANGYNSEVNKTAHLLLGIITLSGILGAAAILLGLFMGGGRALYRRMRGKPASTMHDAEFVSLNLYK